MGAVAVATQGRAESSRARRRAASSALLLAVLGWGTAASAQTGASQASNAAARAGAAVTPGRLDLRLTSLALFGDADHGVECPSVNPPLCAGPNPPSPYRHHVDFFVNETSIDAAYGLTTWLALEARVAFRVLDMRPTFLEPDGSVATRITNEIHHKRETRVGQTDTWLLMRISKTFGRFVPALRLGMSYPTGGTIPDPVPLTERGLEHDHIQFGYGTLIPIVGASVGYVADTFSIGLAELALPALYESWRGYRAPTRSYTVLRGTLFVSQFRPFVEAVYAWEGNDRWNGRVDEAFARSDVLAGGGIGWTFKPGWQIEANGRGLVETLADTAISYPVQISLALDARFE